MSRRMFSPDIVGSDAFMEMPLSSQALYFHLGMRADDDGFVNPQITMRMLGASQDDLKILLAKNFLMPFDNGVVVVKHWRMNNFIRKDRYKPTNYIEQKNLLYVKENMAYTFDETQGLPVGEVEWKSDQQVRSTIGQPLVNAGKVRLGKDRIDNKKVYGVLLNVRLTDEEYEKLMNRYPSSAVKKLIEELSTYMASKGKKYSSHYATLLNWAKRKEIDEKTVSIPVPVVKYTKEDAVKAKELREKMKEKLKEGGILGK